MRAFLLFFTWSVSLLFGEDGVKLLGKAEEESFEGKIVVIEVGESDLGVSQSFKFWERILDRAVEEEAAGVVFDLNTPGGLAFPTKELMSQIAELEIPTRSFVNPSALSAGALIAVATDEIYMKPGSVIGSAGLVSSTGEIEAVMRAKLESFFDAHVRWIAKENGHDPKLVRAMMVLNKEDQEFGPVTVPAGSLLALNSSDAVTITDNGTLLAKAEAATLEEIYEAEGWSEMEVINATPTGFEKLAWWLSMLSPVLIMAGFAGGYLELKTPGFGVGGIVSLSAFSLFFFGNYLAGNMAGYELAAVFGLGLILIAVEIFVLPGFGVAGILGLLCIVGSLLFSMVGIGDWQDYQVSEGGLGSFMDALARPALSFGLGILGSLVVLFLMMRYLPKVPLFNKFMLPETLSAGTGMKVSSEDAEGGELMGKAITDLRPTGKAEFGDEILDVQVDGGFLEKGERVRIVRRNGMGVVVEKVRSEEGFPADGYSASSV